MKAITPDYQIYVMVGIPGSGKSTWCKQHMSDYPYVSRDKIRFSLLKDGEHYFSKEKEVWEIFSRQVKENVFAEHRCIIDATHLNKFSRAKLFATLDKMLGQGTYQTVFFFMNTSLEECFRRNDTRTGREFVPHHAIRSMYDELTMPQMNEHPSIVAVVDIKTPEGE